ncbi:transposase [Spirillospora sp. CA-253888]
MTNGGREALGRSRGGLTTKIHLVADRRCRPIARLASPGQHADCPKFIALMESIRIPRRGVGRPRKKPARALADKAYSSRANRRYLRRRGIKAVIPVKKDQAAHRAGRGSKGGRPPVFDRDAGAIVTETDPDDRRRLLVQPAPQPSRRVEEVRASPIESALAAALGTDDPRRVTEIIDLLEELARHLTPQAVTRLRG